MYRTILFRTVLPLLLAAGVVAYLGLPYIDRLLTNWFRSDVELRSRLVVSTMEETLPGLIARHDQPGLRKYVAKITADQRLVGVLVCGADGWTELKTERVPAAVSCDSTTKLGDGQSDMMRAPWGSVLVSAFDEKPEGQTPYRIEIVNDLSFIDRRQDKARDFLITLACITLVIVALFLVLAAWLVIRRYANMLLRDISGRRFLDNAQSGSLSLPILRQVHQVLREMEESQRLEIDYRENWTPMALQQVVRDQLHSPEMSVVSNREPYSHEFGANDTVEVQV